MKITNEAQAKITSALQKTGFPLENYVCNQLDRGGWYTMNGRYYCDDIDGRAREIDILAYKVSHGETVDVVSALLISCKKDHSNTWVFLSKKKPKADPNYKWDPVCLLSKNPLVNFLVEKDGLIESYKTAMGVSRKTLIDVEKNIFAFQQVANSSPQNDKAIFSSIESLLKAQEYEKS